MPLLTNARRTPLTALWVTAVCLSVGSAGAGPAWADIFVLQSGGQVRGELLNAEESPRKTYQIQTPTGGRISLEAKQVKTVRKQTAKEVQYDKTRYDYPDTIAGQLELAEWCRVNLLPKQRKVHLERVVELQPDHPEARAALGYRRIQGMWMTDDDYRRAMGYVHYKNSEWLLPQEVEILKRTEEAKSKQAAWSSNLKRWYSWLGTNRAGDAIREIKNIHDPAAAGLLAQRLNNPGEDTHEVRMVFVDALANLDDSAGLDTLVNASLYDADHDVRVAALQHVVSHNYVASVPRYVHGLRSDNNQVVLRAAIALGQLQDKSAVGPLIDALITTHTIEIPGTPAGQMAPAFPTGRGAAGGSFNFGGTGPKHVSQQVQNREVLVALVALTGTSFDFDQVAWKNWLASQRKPIVLDARRDN